MLSTRIRISLTADQRRRLDELARRRGTTLARLIREAVDRYLETSGPSAAQALDATFGSAPALEVPSRDEWDRS